MNLVVSSWTSALAGVALVALSLPISLRRAKVGAVSGDGGDDVLRRRIRAQGNFIEYVPLALLLLALSELQGADQFAVVGTAAALVLGRLLHAMGMLSGSTPLRGAGMILTYVSLLLGAMTLVVGAAP